MKRQCGFCKSEDVETVSSGRDIILVCSVCESETLVRYPESMGDSGIKMRDDGVLAEAEHSCLTDF